MKRFFVLLLSIWFLASCSSSKKTTTTTTASDDAVSTPAPPPAKTTAVVVNDGTSFEKAIMIDETTETKGIDAEYAWIKNHYTGYSINGQSLKQHNNKPYDVINISTAEGKKVDLYFDISKFFGK